MATGHLTLDTLERDLDDLFDLATAEPDTAMRRHVPRVYEEAGLDWRSWTTPVFAERFNGLMIRGQPDVGRVFAACFPSAEILDRWLPAARPGDLLITHHPIDLRNGHPSGVWAEGFVPIATRHVEAIVAGGLSVYSCHAPMDTSLRVGTAAAVVEALGGVIEDHFWPYGAGFAGHVCRITPTSTDQLVDRVRRIFGVDLVELKGRRRDTLERVAVVGGIGDRVTEMAGAERLGAQAYLTGEIHVRIEGEYGRRKFAEVEAFAEHTSMSLIGVSHAASEHLVMETQLARWFRDRYDAPVTVLREPTWWR